MADAGVLLNFQTGQAKVFGQWHNLDRTESGHYLVPLTKIMSYKQENITLHATSGLTDEELNRKAVKLHRQFGHCSKENLVRMVKRSKDFNDKRFLKSINVCYDQCKICEKFTKRPLEPVVTTFMSETFNDIVAMDLKFIGKVIVLHLLDTATRYSAAGIVSSKHASEILDCVFRVWIHYFGAPNMFLSDNGGEFANDSLTELGVMFNVVITTTPAESPFSNGHVERHNAILGTTMEKVLMDLNCSASVALAWSVSAKNSLINHHGYSPNQLVFGQNFSLPSVITNRLPAQKIKPTNQKVEEQLNAMIKAREGMVQSECIEKIKRALRHKTRTYSEAVINIGD